MGLHKKVFYFTGASKPTNAHNRSRIILTKVETRFPAGEAKGNSSRRWSAWKIIDSRWTTGKSATVYETSTGASRGFREFLDCGFGRNLIHLVQLQTQQ
jgi:hypothetical protein